MKVITSTLNGRIYMRQATDADIAAEIPHVEIEESEWRDYQVYRDSDLQWQDWLHNLHQKQPRLS